MYDLSKILEVNSNSNIFIIAENNNFGHIQLIFFINSKELFQNLSYNDTSYSPCKNSFSSIVYNEVK